MLALSMKVVSVDVMKRFVASVVGINPLRAIPSQIAKYLGLADPNLFTGHCMRGSFGTALADAGVSVTNLKRAGRWKSSTVAEGYMRESKKLKMDTANALAGRPSNASSSADAQVRMFSSCTFSSCTLVVGMDSAAAAANAQTAVKNGDGDVQ